MAFEVISTKLTSTYTIDSTDSVFLDKDGAVTSGSNAFLGSHDDAMHLIIHGTVASLGTTIYLGVTAADTSALTVLVGETGTVDNLASGTGIFIKRTNADITNHGQISADYRGILFDYDATDGTILNTGKITAQSSSAIYAAGDSASVTGFFNIHNSGLISGALGVQIRNQSLQLFNSGTIIGENSGVSITSNSAVTNTMSLNNTGTIIGVDDYAITGANASDSVINSGRIAGGIEFAAGDDTFIGNRGVVEGDILGGLGNDVLDMRGAAVTGTVFGGQDDDTYFVSDATTTLGELASQGTDTVKSTTGWTLGDNFENLELIGGKNARGIGNDEANTITGNIGDNVLRGKGGADSLNGLDGNDRLFGGNQDDTLSGGTGDDLLRGGQGKDILRGGEDNDDLRGGADNDKLFGNGGNDRLVGGAGKDTLTGGQGIDFFVFQRAGHSRNNSTADKITDFDVGIDRIDLSGLISGDLTFIASSGFSGTAGEVRASTNNGNTLVRVDIDGDGVGDMKVIVENTTSLTELDIIL